MTETFTSLRKTNIFDESLLSTPVENIHLFLDINDKSLSYSLWDKKRKKFIALCDYRLKSDPLISEVEAIIANDEWLQQNNFSLVSSAFHGPSALIPTEVFRKEDALQLLSLTLSVNENTVVRFDHLKYSEIFHLYAENELMTSLLKHFNSSSFLHSGSVFIESEMMRNKNNTEPVVAVNVFAKHYEVVVTHGRKLILYNTFSYANSEDFIYYLLFIMEQLQLNPEKTTLQLTGDIEKSSAAYLITSKYIRNIVFGERPDADFSYGFDSISSHAHYNLLRQYLCA